jgi:hypothetical protein
MYVIFIKNENEEPHSYLNKNKKIVAKLDIDAIFDTYSEAGNKARSVIKGAKIISIKDFLLSDEGSKLFKEFCLTLP